MPKWAVRFDLRLDDRNPELLNVLTKAEALASVIRGIPLPPHVYDRLDRLNIARAVRGTTGIEGAELSEDEVARILDTSEAVLGAARHREEQEARNAGEVMRFTASLLDAEPDAPLTEQLICHLHEMTTVGIDYPNNVPGRYRSHAVRAGTYLPPESYEEVRALMTEFVDWLNGPKSLELHPVARAVAAHFYFISIHPFGDGNGRTARAIESYLLYQARLNVVGFYSLSNYYYRKRPEYIAILDFVRFRSAGELTPFVLFAARGLVEELEIVRTDLLEEVTLIAFRDFVREQLEQDHALTSKVRSRLLQLALSLGRATIPPADIGGRGHLAQLYRGKSLKTLNRDLAYLQRAGIVVKEEGGIRANLGLMDRFKR